MSVTISTFGATHEHLSTLDNQQQNEPDSQNQTQNQDANANAQGSADNGVQHNQDANPDNQPQEQDFNSSAFTLGDDTDVNPNNDTQQQQQQAQPQFNLDEELKKVDRKELLKKLGVSDFAIELNDYTASGKSAIDYLNAKAIDYNQVSDDNLLKNNLQKQFPTFTPQQIDLYFNKKYGVSEIADDDEREFAELTKKADAHTLRQKLIEDQKNFKIPDATTPQTDEAYEQWKQYREFQSQAIEQNSSFYLNHAATKSLHENKKVAINVGDGVAPFNITIDKPEMITNSFVDGGKTWQRLTSTQSGEPDVQKQQMIALFTFNPQKFIQDLFNYGLQQGKRSLVSEGQNAQRPQTKVLPISPDQKPTYGLGKFGDRARN